MVNIPSQDVYEYNACNAAFSLPHVGYPNLFQAIDFQSIILSLTIEGVSVQEETNIEKSINELLRVLRNRNVEIFFVIC